MLLSGLNKMVKKIINVASETQKLEYLISLKV